MATPARPNKNSNGQTKQPSAPPIPAPKPQLASGVNPLSHPAHPLQQPGSPLVPKGPVLPGSAGSPDGAKLSQLDPINKPNPSGNPEGIITPNPTSDVRQVRQNIGFKDMSPIEQGQVAQQQGLDPYAPLKMVSGEAGQALQQGATGASPVPNTMMGPFTPPGVEAFPDDMAHLTALMQQGHAPGASPQEHQMALNAGAISRARDAASAAQANDAQVHDANVQQLGGLLHHLGSTGQLPHPADVAAHVVGLQNAQQQMPQLAGVPSPTGPDQGTGLPPSLNGAAPDQTLPPGPPPGMPQMPPDPSQGMAPGAPGAAQPAAAPPQGAGSPAGQAGPMPSPSPGQAPTGPGGPGPGAPGAMPPPPVAPPGSPPAGPVPPEILAMLRRRAMAGR